MGCSFQKCWLERRPACDGSDLFPWPSCRVVAGTVKIDPQSAGQSRSGLSAGELVLATSSREPAPNWRPFASLGARRVSRDVTDGGERKRMERETQTKKARTCHSPRAGGRRCCQRSRARGRSGFGAAVSGRAAARHGPVRLARHGPRNCHRHKARNLASR